MKPLSLFLEVFIRVFIVIILLNSINFPVPEIFILIIIGPLILWVFKPIYDSIQIENFVTNEINKAEKRYQDALKRLMKR
jgi:hypothetical protein